MRPATGLWKLSRHLAKLCHRKGYPSSDNKKRYPKASHNASLHSGQSLGNAGLYPKACHNASLRGGHRAWEMLVCMPKHATASAYVQAIVSAWRRRQSPKGCQGRHQMPMGAFRTLGYTTPHIQGQSQGQSTRCWRDHIIRWRIRSQSVTSCDQLVEALWCRSKACAIDLAKPWPENPNMISGFAGMFPQS